MSKEIHKNIHSIVITGGGQYVWASTSELYPLFKVVDFKESTVSERDIGKRNIGGRKRVEGVLCMTTTTDGKSILAGTLDGAIIKISIKSSKNYKFFPELHRSPLICIESLSDCTSIITASQDNHLRRYSISEKKLVISHDFGAVFDKPISIMKQMDQNNLLFVGNEDGYLKLICLTQNNVIRDLGNFQNVPVTGIAISLDNKKVFIGSSKGDLIEYSVNSGVVQYYGKIVDSIYSMCI
jgi:WD40 repeat protein